MDNKINNQSIINHIQVFKNSNEIIGRATNDAPDKVIDRLLSFYQGYINKLITGITNIYDEALTAVYTLIGPRRVKNFQLMRITNILDLDKLNKKYNWLVLERGNKPSVFYFCNHKTSKSYPEQKNNNSN